MVATKPTITKAIERFHNFAFLSEEILMGEEAITQQNSIFYHLPFYNTSL
jgi:hypothetical protein